MTSRASRLPLKSWHGEPDRIAGSGWLPLAWAGSKATGVDWRGQERTEVLTNLTKGTTVPAPGRGLSKPDREEETLLCMLLASPSCPSTLPKVDLALGRVGPSFRALGYGGEVRTKPPGPQGAHSANRTAWGGRRDLNPRVPAQEMPITSRLLSTMLSHDHRKVVSG